MVERVPKDDSKANCKLVLRAIADSEGNPSSLGVESVLVATKNIANGDKLFLGLTMTNPINRESKDNHELMNELAATNGGVASVNHRRDLEHKDEL
jgi:hypothetical protein